MTIDLSKYQREDGGYWLQPLERDAAAATGADYYEIIESETLDMLPEDWRQAIIQAAAITREIDATKQPRKVSNGRMSEWEIRDGTAE